MLAKAARVVQASTCFEVGIGMAEGLGSVAVIPYGFRYRTSGANYPPCAPVAKSDWTLLGCIFMDPRKLPPSRNTYLHPAPVRSYTLDFELDYDPGYSPLDLRRYGLRSASDEESVLVQDAVGDVPFQGVHVDHEGKVWVCDIKVNQPSLVPFPFERVRFEVGDEVIAPVAPDRPGGPKLGEIKFVPGTVTEVLQSNIRDLERQEVYVQWKMSKPGAMGWEVKGPPEKERVQGFRLYRGEFLLHV